MMSSFVRHNGGEDQLFVTLQLVTPTYMSGELFIFISTSHTVVSCCPVLSSGTHGDALFLAVGVINPCWALRVFSDFRQNVLTASFASGRWNSLSNYSNCLGKTMLFLSDSDTAKTIWVVCPTFTIWPLLNILLLSSWSFKLTSVYLSSLLQALVCSCLFAHWPFTAAATCK